MSRAGDFPWRSLDFRWPLVDTCHGMARPVMHEFVGIVGSVARFRDHVEDEMKDVKTVDGRGIC